MKQQEKRLPFIFPTPTKPCHQKSTTEEPPDVLGKLNGYNRHIRRLCLQKWFPGMDKNGAVCSIKKAGTVVSSATKNRQGIPGRLQEEALVLAIKRQSCTRDLDPMFQQAIHSTRNHQAGSAPQATRHLSFGQTPGVTRQQSTTAM